MNVVSADYLSRAEFWLMITTLVYFMMNGAGIYETAVLIPKWTSNAPESLQVLAGKYAPDLKLFWIAVHSLHEITFVAAIGFCWQLTGVRTCLLILFALHFAVRLWTIAWFAPRIIEFQKIASSGFIIHDTSLRARVILWRKLNYLRTGLFIILSIAVLIVWLGLRHC